MRYPQDLKSKSVVLVGPASYMDGSSFGPMIESFDIVARVGQTFPISNPADLGVRCDIIFENFWSWFDKVNHHDPQMVYDYWLTNNVKHVRMVFPENKGYEQFRELNANRISYSHIPELERNQIVDEVKAPTKGILAIRDLLNAGVKSLHVVGMSFSQGYGYCKDYLNSPSYVSKDAWLLDEPVSIVKLNEQTDHYPIAEIKHLKSLMSKHPNLTTDETLGALINVIPND